MTTKKATLIACSVTCIIIALSTSSCSHHHSRRWYSVYKDKNGEEQVEHYNGYRKRWYRRNWNNRRMWK